MDFTYTNVRDPFTVNRKVAKIIMPPFLLVFIAAFIWGLIEVTEYGNLFSTIGMALFCLPFFIIGISIYASLFQKIVVENDWKQIRLATDVIEMILKNDESMKIDYAELVQIKCEVTSMSKQAQIRHYLKYRLDLILYKQDKIPHYYALDYDSLYPVLEDKSADLVGFIHEHHANLIQKSSRIMGWIICLLFTLGLIFFFIGVLISTSAA